MNSFANPVSEVASVSNASTTRSSRSQIYAALKEKERRAKKAVKPATPPRIPLKAQEVHPIYEEEKAFRHDLHSYDETLTTHDSTKNSLESKEGDSTISSKNSETKSISSKIAPGNRARVLAEIMKKKEDTKKREMQKIEASMTKNKVPVVEIEKENEEDTISFLPNRKDFLHEIRRNFLQKEDEEIPDVVAQVSLELKEIYIPNISHQQRKAYISEKQRSSKNDRGMLHDTQAFLQRSAQAISKLEDGIMSKENKAKFMRAVENTIFGTGREEETVPRHTYPERVMQQMHSRPLMRNQKTSPNRKAYDFGLAASSSTCSSDYTSRDSGSSSYDSYSTYSSRSSYDSW